MVSRPRTASPRSRLDEQVKRGSLNLVTGEGKGIAGIDTSLAALGDWKESGEMMDDGSLLQRTLRRRACDPSSSSNVAQSPRPCNGGCVREPAIRAEDPAQPLAACVDRGRFRIVDQASVPGLPCSREKVRVRPSFKSRWRTRSALSRAQGQSPVNDARHKRLNTLVLSH